MLNTRNIKADLMLDSGFFHPRSAKLLKKAHSAIKSIKEQTQMKKIVIAAMSLALLTGTVVFAHQDTSTDTMKKKSKKKKSKKGSSTDSMAAPK